MDNSCEIRIGTSGFSYKEGLGGFYPPRLPRARMLGHYAERFSTVEINYTFRAMPRRTLLEGWIAKTPLDFRFALKAPQRITHFARLRGTAESLTYFIETIAILGNRLGPVLFQLPPDLPRDDALLNDFLAQIGGRALSAFEFRHRSWLDDTVFDLLHRANAALCVAESDRMATPVIRTASHSYLRLRLGDYDDTALAAWAQQIRVLARDTEQIYIYFKHEAAAPELASRLQKLLAAA